MTREDAIRQRLELRDGVLLLKPSGVPITTRLDRDGYRCLTLCAGGKQFNLFEHRVIWFLHYGAWPQRTIDHINHDRADNRICNLRDVSQSENNRNQVLPKPRRMGRPYSPEVAGWSTRASNGWMAFIKPVAVRVYLGKFDTKAEADAARQGASRLLNALRSPALAGEPGAAAIVPPDVAAASFREDRLHHGDAYTTDPTPNFFGHLS